MEITREMADKARENCRGKLVDWVLSKDDYIKQLEERINKAEKEKEDHKKP